MAILQVELKSIAGDALTMSYQNFGSALSNPALKVQFINDSAVRAFVSKDGSADWMLIPANGSLTWDESTYNTPRDGEEYYLPKGTQLEIKYDTGAGAAGTKIWAHVVTRIR